MDSFDRPQKIAVVGTGISGLTASYLLSRRHDITVFEANDYIGGHTHTVDVQSSEGTYAIDTGFIVFNDRTYPNFQKILNQLGVAYQKSSMSFSVRDDRTGLEYNGTSVNKLFAQRRNLINSAFYRMLFDILRFNKRARALLEEKNETLTLGEFIEQSRLSAGLREQYLIPMGAAVWSANPESMRDFPALYFIRFFENHGLLGFGNRPRWLVIKGGSREYVKAITKTFAGRIRLSTPVRSIRRHDDYVEVYSDDNEPERFDLIVLACHSDQALKMLADPSEEEQDILGAIGYQPNDTVLHTDTSILPRKKLAWGSWNYLVPLRQQQRVAVTYYMNHLQSLRAKNDYCVTLNYTPNINRDEILREFEYHHPVYTIKGIEAQRRRDEICGQRRTFYAGAYWGFGFHEDGVRSALHACEKLGETL
ncbi:MAG: NAD(P)-binding protein [candidate division Zixibacteria bacterium]|nr:NAD(P)-binding protein [candidate division Zixibacteria bacterium]